MTIIEAGQFVDKSRIEHHIRLDTTRIQSWSRSVCDALRQAISPVPGVVGCYINRFSRGELVVYVRGSLSECEHRDTLLAVLSTLQECGYHEGSLDAALPPQLLTRD